MIYIGVCLVSALVVLIYIGEGTVSTWVELNTPSHTYDMRA